MSQSSTQQSLRQRALKAMITEAFFDWKSAVVVALTVLLTFLVGESIPGWQWWYWLAGGLAAWAAVFAINMRSQAFGARVVAEMLRKEFNPAQIRNKKSRADIDKALAYQQRIVEAANRAREGLLRDHLQETTRQIEDWIANMYTLAQRLDSYEVNDVIHQDLRSVPKAIEGLQARLRQEDDPTVRQQIEQTIQAKDRQLASLNRLGNMMEKVELQMDSTITALGTVYTQLLLLGAKDVDSGRAQRLRENIQEEVNQLHDLVGSVDEVYEHRT